MGDGISVNDAVSKWHITQKQAENLNKMDGNAKDEKITGNVYDMAKEYYEGLEQQGVQYGENEGKTLIKMIKNTLKEIKKMKSPANTEEAGAEQGTTDVEYTAEEAEAAKDFLNGWLDKYKNGKCTLEELKENVEYKYSGEDIKLVKDNCPEVYNLLYPNDTKASEYHELVQLALNGNTAALKNLLDLFQENETAFSEFLENLSEDDKNALINLLREVGVDVIDNDTTKQTKEKPPIGL